MLSLNGGQAGEETRLLWKNTDIFILVYSKLIIYSISGIAKIPVPIKIWIFENGGRIESRISTVRFMTLINLARESVTAAELLAAKRLIEIERKRM